MEAARRGSRERGGHVPRASGVTEVETKKRRHMMRVFVAGASGAIGSRLVPQLVQAGHDVIGSVRTPEKAAGVKRLGAKPVVLDLLERESVVNAIGTTKPDAIIHQATALADIRFSRNMDRTFEQTNRLRTKGTHNLLAAARGAGSDRFIAQSFASMRCARTGPMVKTEEDPLDPSPVKGTEAMHAAMRYLDQTVTEAGGIVLRYGGFYGADNDAMVTPVRKRQFPIIGDGGGFSSWTPLEAAAAAPVRAPGQDGRAIYNIVDDDPAPARDWLRVLADFLGPKPPRRFPRWLARIVV